MGSKVALLNDIYTRLNTAIGSGKALDGVKRVQIGARDEARKNNDLPIININLLGGDEIAFGQPNIKVDKMAIQISLLVAKLDLTNENHLYNTGTGTGALYLFEDMLDTIDKTVGDVIDLTYGETANELPTYDYEVIYGGGFIRFDLNLEVDTAQFTVGSR